VPEGFLPHVRIKNNLLFCFGHFESALKVAAFRGLGLALAALFRTWH
jgi:hypothetical protein